MGRYETRELTEIFVSAYSYPSGEDYGCSNAALDCQLPKLVGEISQSEFRLHSSRVCVSPPHRAPCV